MQQMKYLMQYPRNSNPQQPSQEREFPIPSPPKAKPLAEVQIVNEGNRVFDHYRELYKQRYTHYPILLDESDAIARTKKLIRKVGIEKALALVEKYLSMNGDGDWYLRTGHTLKTLESKIEEVNAALGVDMKRANPPGQDYNPLIIFDTQCPNCKVTYSIKCHAKEAESQSYTTLCGKCRE